MATRSGCDVNTIRDALTTPSKCSSTTVTLVRDLLNGANATDPHGNVQSRLTRPTSRIRSKTLVKVHEEPTRPLKPEEKLLLATETVNASLKALSDALKNPPAATQRHPTAQKSKPSPDRENTPSPSKSELLETSRRTSSITNGALRPRQSNASLRSTALNQENATPLKKDGGRNAGIAAVAECARVAFAYLRSTDRETHSNTPSLQLENGMLALISKCVAHKLDQPALKELRQLKKRLDQTPRNARSEIPDIRGGRQDASQLKEKETIADLLRFESVEPTDPKLPLVISHQLQVLAVVCFRPASVIIESIMPFLELDFPQSPTNLLLLKAQSPAMRAKSAQQLESLARTMLYLSVTDFTEDTSRDRKQTLRPETALRLQWLGLRSRISWWRLTGHEPNLGKEVQMPLSKILVSLSRRSLANPKACYDLAEYIYDDLRNALVDFDNSSAEGTSENLTILRALSVLAQNAGDTSAAIAWASKAQSCCVRAKSSDAKLAAISVRLATVHLERPSPDATIALQQALKCMKGSLRGDSAEVDALLIDVSSLRKTIAQHVSRDPPPDNASTLYEGAFSCMQFLVRFLGSAPAADAEAKAHVRFGERMALARKAMRSFIDTVFICSKQLTNLPDTSLDAFDAVLQDCCTFLSTVVSVDNRHDQTHKDLGQPFVKISSIYYSYYARRAKSSGAGDLQTTTALIRSVEVLRHCSVEDKAAGFFTTKLEKLAEVYQKSKSYFSAYIALEEATAENIARGALQQAAELAQSRPLRVAFGSEAPADFYRVAKRKHQLKTSASLLLDEDEDTVLNRIVSKDQRAVLLEMQLGLHAQSLLTSPTLDTRLAAEIRRTVDSLLDIYTADEHPIRRQRVAATALRMVADHPEVLLPSQVEVLKTTPQVIDMRKLSADAKLAGFLEDMNASLRLAVALQGKPVHRHTIVQSLLVWQRILESCRTWEELCTCVDDAGVLISQLQSISDYFDLQRLDNDLIPTLHLLSKVIELVEPADLNILVSTISRTGLRLLRMGYSGKAGLTLAKAEHFVQTVDLRTETKLKYHLAYAEYLLAIGATEQCRKTLEAAMAVARGDATLMLAVIGSNSNARIQIIRLLADSFHISSRYCMEIGAIEQTFDYARRNAKLIQHLYAELLKKRESKRTTDVVETHDRADEIDKLTNGMSSLMNKPATEQNVVLSQVIDSSSGPVLWPLITALIDSYRYLARFFVHCGYLQEANFYLQKAVNFANATGSEASKLVVSNDMADLYIQAERVEKAQTYLDQATAVRPKVKNSLEVVRYHQNVSKMWATRKEEEDARESLDEALRTVERLATGSQMPADKFISAEDGLTESVAKLQLEDQPTLKRTRTTRTTKPTRRVPSKAASRTASVKRSSPDVLMAETATAECIPIRSLQSSLLRAKAVSVQFPAHLTTASELLEEAGLHQHNGDAVIQQSVAAFRVTLAQALKGIASDFTFNVLPESTISLPAVTLAKVETKLHGKGAVLSPPKENMVTKSSTPAKKSRPKAVEKPSDFMTLLQKARDGLRDVHQLAIQRGSNATVQLVSSLLTSVSILLSSATQASGNLAIDALSTGLCLDFPKIHSEQLERSIYRIENTHIPRAQLFSWPELNDEAHESLSPGTFQQDYVDIIPDTWTAVSLNLNETKDDLLVTRYRAGQSPFILRLPLARQRTDDADEEIFDYAEGMAELKDIIDGANASAHNSKTVNTKEEREKWWTTRSELDSRLEHLLHNIENIWLGGFRGIFAQQVPQPTPLARFQKSLQATLKRHLPSRRGKTARKQVALDLRILELFTGLGDPGDEGVDLDEQLMDLLYFVVDILQFNGEKNAYDEVDFDSMIVETTDALKAYHAAAAAAGPSAEHIQRHTILILDKDLHGVPWESMNCLSQLSVTRLPSLSALRTRILALSASSPSGIHISGSRGHSILNPSGDLRSTQSVMSPHLHTLPSGWTHSTVPPTESSLAALLPSTPLFLYFGHGSGAQYIRPRTVRRLPACPAAWLMGCSSSAIAHNGAAFAPSGMVLAYLHAGAPAVLGTLWDVTDRDCDRASVATGVSWGLWEEQQEAMERISLKGYRREGGVPAGARCKRADATAKRRSAEGRREKLSLAEAVVDGRHACHFKYLNGAALVVYGVPVYLSH